MSVNLCIDWGNSRVKTAIFNETDQLVDKQNFSGEEAAAGIAAIIEQHRPAKGILCSVTEGSFSIENMLKDSLKAFVKLDDRTQLPIMNAYSSPGTLGADRIALAVAAHSFYPDKNNLVISLGTCITYNFVQKNKTFRGGAISPGFKMRLDAMHQFAYRLPEVPAEGELLLLGYDTATGMRSGAVHGMTAEIDGMVELFMGQYPDFNAVLTGGDMSFFAGRLKNKIFADPDLLMKGLNTILKYNVPHIR
jgi:type III pantothenate kinase